MALSYVSYTGDNSTVQYDLTFPYIDQTHIKVYIDGVEDSSFTWINTSRIQTSSTPATGAVIKIDRDTPTTSRLVDFQDGSVLSETDLDKSANQNFYVAQEIVDLSSDLLGLNASSLWDAESKRIINVANPTANQDAVTKYYLENTWLSTSDKANINTLAGISSDVTTVAGISSNVTSVAGNSTNINTVAGAISNVNNVGGSIANVNTVADDLNEGTSEIDTVATNIANVNLVGGSITNVNSVAGGLTNINAVGSDLLEGTSEIDTVATNIANVNTVGGISSDVTSVAGISSNVTSVASNSSNINSVASNSSNINSVAGSIANVNTTAGDIANVNTTAGSITNVNTVASNISNVNNFADRYRIASSDPSTSLDEGDLVYNSTSNALKYYDGSSWNAITSDTDVKAGVSSNDTTPDYLLNKFTAGSNITLTETNDGGDETITIASTDNSVVMAIALGS